jgi:cellulose synthase/poly-beta-1,6-N-acetylglucosamine synthase-like glycosyltransferase
MMELLALVILCIYTVSLLIIFSYGIAQLSLVVSYLNSKSVIPIINSDEVIPVAELPIVTVQLPIYNELYVVERLMDAVSLLNYPKDKLEIQMLDDSEDETTDIIRKKMFQFQAMGFDVVHIRRPDRTGFKAGALSYGLQLAKGEFIAIFDADFMPKPNFLISTLPQFLRPQVGVVQTRWEHLNKDYSLITKLQAFGLDAHFTVEQTGRNSAGHFINFNGTAGIWRKQCIIESGGWQSDTLTEVRYTDLGPFRAIKWNKLLQLKMNDQNFGWTVEMQLKAAKLNLKIMEVPVTYRKRIGVSKVSGTLKGTVMAGYKIISTIFKYL